MRKGGVISTRNFHGSVIINGRYAAEKLQGDG
jgi:hypothetical protein